jgi:hypothetical protein
MLPNNSRFMLRSHGVRVRIVDLSLLRQVIDVDHCLHVKLQQRVLLDMQHGLYLRELSRLESKDRYRLR